MKKIKKILIIISSLIIFIFCICVLQYCYMLYERRNFCATTDSFERIVSACHYATNGAFRDRRQERYDAFYNFLKRKTIEDQKKNLLYEKDITRFDYVSKEIRFLDIMIYEYISCINYSKICNRRDESLIKNNLKKCIAKGNKECEGLLRGMEMYESDNGIN